MVRFTIAGAPAFDQSILLEGSIICPVGGGGGAVCVVALALADCAETFPAASMAETVYVYVVAAESPVFEYVVPVTVAICVPPR